MKKRKTLKSLYEFLINNLKDFIDTVHILPFLPSSSVMDLQSQIFLIDSKYGDWKDIKNFHRF